MVTSFPTSYADNTLYGIPNPFYDCLFLNPTVDGGDEMDRWIELLHHVASEYTSYQCQIRIIGNVIHNIDLVFFNLVFDYFREQRDTCYYADKLCITPNYLAMIVRQVCKESPKEAIDRQVVSEMKYMKKNVCGILWQLKCQQRIIIIEPQRNRVYEIEVLMWELMPRHGDKKRVLLMLFHQGMEKKECCSCCFIKAESSCEHHRLRLTL